MILEPGLREYNVDLNEISINFLCRYSPGSEEAILFLHGLACTKNSFRNVFDKEYFPGKTLILPDFAGFGKSSKPDGFSYSMQYHADIISGILSDLPLFNLHIAAHSMGGAIALLFSQDIFSRVLSFSNIEGNLVAEDCGIMSRSISSLSFEAFRDRLYPKLINTFKGHSQLHFEESTPEAIYKSAVSLVQLSDSGDLLNRFNNLTCRTSYFYGEENKDIEVIEKLTTKSKFMISGSGHGLMTDNPKEFYTKLAEFTNSYSRFKKAD